MSKEFINILIAAHDLQRPPCHCLITGSLALLLLGQMDREPHDLDIVVQDEDALKYLIENTRLTYKGCNTPEGGEKEYSPGATYGYDDMRVCVFIDDMVAHPKSVMGLSLCAPAKIWEAKQRYANDDQGKHIKDIAGRSRP